MYMYFYCIDQKLTCYLVMVKEIETTSLLLKMYFVVGIFLILFISKFIKVHVVLTNVQARKT